MNSDFCFATLALGKPYREMAQALSADLFAFAPGETLVIATDCPADFSGCANVRAFRQEQTGFFRCVNDKRFAIAFALDHCAETAVFIDADTRIHRELPGEISVDSPITTVWAPNLEEHAVKWLLPKDRDAVLRAAKVFGIDPSAGKLVWDNLFAVSRDRDRHRVFVKTWEIITRLFDFQGISIGDGYCMGIAAAVVGWIPGETGLKPFDDAREHSGVGQITTTADLHSRLASRAIMWCRRLKFRRKIIASVSRAQSDDPEL